MYGTILMPLDASPADRPIIEHVKKLAGIMHSRIVVLHVATGASAQFHGDDAAGEEVDKSRAYLNQVKAEFEAAGISAVAELVSGDPVREIAVESTAPPIGITEGRPAVLGSKHMVSSCHYLASLAGLRMFPRGAANFQSGFHRRFRLVIENESHPVTSRDYDEPPIRLGCAKMFGLTDDAIKQLE